MHDEFLSDILIVLAAVLAVALFHRLRMPAVIAYLLVGILVGPHALNWLPVVRDGSLRATLRRPSSRIRRPVRAEQRHLDSAREQLKSRAEQQPAFHCVIHSGSQVEVRNGDI